MRIPRGSASLDDYPSPAISDRTSEGTTFRACSGALPRDSARLVRRHQATRGQSGSPVGGTRPTLRWTDTGRGAGFVLGAAGPK